MLNRLKNLFLIGLLSNILGFSQATEWPKTILLKQSTELTVFHQGKAVGKMVLPPGRMVEVQSRSNDWLMVQSGIAEGKVLIKDTDFNEKLKKTISSINPVSKNIKKEKESILINAMAWHVRKSLVKEEIQKLIETLYQKNQGTVMLQECVAALWTNAATASFYPAWIEHLRMAQAIAMWQVAGGTNSALDQETAFSLFTNKPLMESFGATISPGDKPKEIWKILADLQKTFPNQMEEYHALAVALAVVHDEPFPTNWPNSQAGVIPRKNENWTELFRYFTDRDREGRLFLKLTQLEADQLKFVVDAPIDLSEFEWANKNVKFSRREFDRSYFFVSYDDARLEKQIYDWPWKEAYTLENIAKRNGICIDQAYFSFLSGKAKGLPTLVFSGAGKSGYHAWFGYMKADDQWEMNAGRYTTDGYVVGETIDPQTRQSINDHQLEIISSRMTSTPVYQQSQNLLILAGLTASLKPSLLNSKETNNPVASSSFTMQAIQPDDYKTLLQSALKICPANAEAWLRLSQWLETNATSQELQLHYTSMIEQFKNQKDLKTWAQERLSQIVRATGNVAAAETLQKNIMNDNRRDRTDLGVASTAELLRKKIKNGEYDSALVDFCRIVKSYKKEGGGTLFFDLVDPFIRDVQKNGQDQIAKKALQFAQNTMDYDHDPTSQVQQGFEELCHLLNVKIKTR